MYPAVLGAQIRVGKARQCVQVAEKYRKAEKYMSIIEVCGGILGAAAAEERAPLPPRRWPLAEVTGGSASEAWAAAAASEATGVTTVALGATERTGGAGACLMFMLALKEATTCKDQKWTVEVSEGSLL